MAFQIFLKRATGADNSPLSGGKAYIYETGTTTPVTTYSDTALTTPNANPLVADSAGRFGQAFYNGSVDVKVVYTNSSDVTQETRDPAPITFQGDFTVGGAVTFSDEVFFTAPAGSQPIIKTTFPSLKFWDTDGTTTHNRGSISWADDSIQFTVSDNTGASVNQAVIIAYGASGGVTHKFRVGSVDQLHVGANVIRAGNDDATDLGSGTFRFDDVYATNGTIQTSGEDFKDQIAPVSLGLDFIKAVEPIEYKIKGGRSGRTHTGLSAENVKEAVEGSGKTTADFAGYVEGQREDGTTFKGLRYHEFIGPLIKAVHELTERIEELTERIEALEGKK